jgi:Holliday junction resolvasome RuvABC ATP-dependent DNA helicase subunit
MHNHNPVFDKLIGQNHIKRQLSFYLRAAKNNGVLPFLMFNGQKGIGKTEFVRAFVKGAKKSYLEINASTIKNEEQFFEQIMLPKINDQDVTLFLDEAHELPKKLVATFLTIFNTEKSHIKEFTYRDMDFTFDFSRQSFVFATSELDKVFVPFKDRLTVVDFAPYSDSETKEIIKMRLPDVNFQDDILTEVVTTVRGNARSAVKRSMDILKHCDGKNSTNFSAKDWKELCYEVNINKNGLSHTEIQVLQALKQRGPSTLTMLSAITGMSRTSLQRDVETHLLKHNYLRIDGTRQITGTGLQFLEQIG